MGNDKMNGLDMMNGMIVGMFSLVICFIILYN